jgi:type IV pilus assembly protein PilN
MIPLNLLPHRAERRRAQQRQFAFMAVFAAFLGVVIVVLVHGIFSQRIDFQTRRNAYIEAEIAVLEKQIDEIKRLKEQTQALLARKRVVESLQSNRTESVRLLDQLVRQLPDGVFLKSVKQVGPKVNITGYASSNARVSTLMRNFDASAWLESATLIEIKSAKVGSQILNEFSLSVMLSRPQEETADSKKAPGQTPGKPDTKPKA